MQKLQDSVFTLVKTTNLSPAVFSFLQPTDDSVDKTPLGGILKDTKHGWLALGPKFCVVDLRTGMKVAARTFGASLSNNAIVTSVVELPTPLTENSQQLVISLQCDDISIIVTLNINGSQILRCIQTDVVVTQLTICDNAPDGIFTCFDGIVIAGTKRGEIFAYDLNRAMLIQALKYISQGYEHLVHNELKPTNLSFLPLEAVNRIDEQRELALQNDHHLALLLNENSFIDGQYIFRNPDGSVRMKAKRDHIRVTVLEYIPQTGSVAAGFNFGAFQIWNLMNLDLEFTSQVNVECLPVTHFGFQEPCDDPRAFCYLWVIFSVIDRYEEEEFPLAVMYSLTYQGKRMLSDTKCLYQDFTSATIRFQVELSNVNDAPLLGGKCISCHTYSIKSTLGDEGEDNMLNLCQLVWECWAENINLPTQYGMLLFDLDQWYKDQMPSTYRVESNAFLSASSWAEMSGGSGSVALHARLDPASVTPYSHATRLEEHFYPNSLLFNCICLNTSEVCVLGTIGVQRQIITSIADAGPTALLHPPGLYAACTACGLAPLYAMHHCITQEDQRRYLLSVALEARLSRFLKRCAHDWATGTHSGVGCTLTFLVDWCWKRAIELKENAKELTAPLFISSSLPDRNIVRCLEHCVQQLTQLTGLMDAILTKCCNLVVPDALSEMEEKHKGISTVSLYFQVVQWFLRVGLLPERVDGSEALPYPAIQLYGIYNKRRLKLNRIQDNGVVEENSAHKSCVLLYIDQLLEQEFGGERIHQMWINGGSECRGLYPPPSLYALLRLYLLPDISEEHKHSLVLYLLVDYSVIYDDVRYETVIRRLMQFPTMFGLSNTAIKATQAFWHLDHRDFDFALDQLQCLTGNTLSEWQHNVVLSSLLAQKKTQAALQYLHVRKPAPIQNIKDGDFSRINDYDKLDDWQSCCNLYLARGLVYEALDVIRMCVQNAASQNDKVKVLNTFYKGCRNTGNLSKIISISFLPLEEEVFIKYLENCNEPQTSDVLIMYYLQQSRYLEAERYNMKLRHTKPKSKDITGSAESLFDSTDSESARNQLVEAMCAALPTIAETVAHCAFDQKDLDWHVEAPKPMSVFVQAKTSKNSFTYKSSFIQDTIQNASETWVNRPTIRKGLKRMLNIEETPFICTPKLSRSRSVYADMQESTPPKRPRLNLTGTPKTPRSSFKVSDKLSGQMEKLLDMPEIQSPVGRIYERPETPHSILKLRRNSRCEVPSPTGCRYLDDSDDELEMETASNHTHYSDTTNKHLRFTIPTPTEICTDTTPSPTPSRRMPIFEMPNERERSVSTEQERDQDISTTESYVTTASHAMNESNPLESPPKKLATEINVATKKHYKDSVRGRRSFSVSANSSLSDDPNTSIESIADIPITLINPKYSGIRRRSQSTESRVSEEKTETEDITLKYVGAREIETRRSLFESVISEIDSDKTETQDMPLRYVGARESSKEKEDRLEVPITPRGRRGIRVSGESTPLRGGSMTPERQDSPAMTPLRSSRLSRSRSKTPELSPRSSPLPPIMEQPKQEMESEPHSQRSVIVPRSLRSKSRTPERKDKVFSDSPKLEAIKESPTKTTASPPASPARCSFKSRSRTPERMVLEVSEPPQLETIKESKSVGTSPPTSPARHRLKSRSRTPERMVLEVSEPPQLETIKESKSVGTSPPPSPARQTPRSRSGTPGRMVAEVESPHLEDIKESVSSPASPSPRSLRSRSRTPDRMLTEVQDIKESVSSPASPSARSLRSRSRTPEVEVIQEQVIQPSPRSLRSRSKTPERIMSPKKEHSVRTKKSLSRLVLEANTFAKTKQTLELLEAESSAEAKSDSVETLETTESALECTPMKSLKQVPSLMDVTLSPIINKSILQSSTESELSESVEKQPKDSGNTDVNLKPLPAFAPLQETYFEKSVLHSYQSSVGDCSVSITEETVTKSVELKPMPAFTTIHEDFGRSVLHSYESSVAESSQSVVDETPKKYQSKPFPETPINTEFGSVLDSQQSSLADTQPLNVSSLITDDSDVEMTETENQERAEQKEKEQIVEIEREIHEIEDMSNENESEDDSSDTSSEQSVEEIQDSSDSSVQQATSSDSDSESGESEPPPPTFDRPSLLSTEMLDKIMEAKYKSMSKKSQDDSDDSSGSKGIESDKTEKNDSESDSSNPSKTVDSKPKKSDTDESNAKSDSESDESSDSDEIEENLEETEEKQQKDNLENVSMMTDDYSIVIDDDIEVVTPNPLDQAQISLPTDDDVTMQEDITTKSLDETIPTQEIQTREESPTQIESKEQVLTIPATKKTQIRDKSPTQIESKEELLTIPASKETQIREKTPTQIENKEQVITIPASKETQIREKSPSQIVSKAQVLTIPATKETQIREKSPTQIESKEEELSIPASKETQIRKKIPTQIESKEQVTKETQIREKTPTQIESYEQVTIPANKEIKIEEESQIIESKDPILAVPKHDEKQVKNTEQTVTDIPSQKVIDFLANVSMMTEDNSQSSEEISINLSTDANIPDKEKDEQETKLHCNIIVQDITQKSEVVIEEPIIKSIDVVDTSASETEMKDPEVVTIKKVTSEKMDIDPKSDVETAKPNTEEPLKISQPDGVQEILSSLKEPKTILDIKKVEKIGTDKISQKKTLESVTQEISKPKTVETSKSNRVTEQTEIVKDSEMAVTESQNIESKTETTKVSEPKIIQEAEKPESAKEPTEKTIDMDTDLTVPKSSKLVPKVVSEPENTKEPINEKQDTVTDSQALESDTVKSIRTRKRVKSTSSNTEIESQEPPKTPATRKRAQSRTKSIDVEIPKQTEEPTTSHLEIGQKTPTTRKRAQSRAKSIDIGTIDEPQTPVTRKRAAKTAETPKEEVITSNKTEDEPKTPITRKRTQSIQSEKSPDDVTPSRRKTPAPEVRKIITRRMSREMKELDESNRSIDESLNRSRNVDDNESVASESSLTSSVLSEKRRGRKSTLATKPDLSVIPEAIAEGESILDLEYSSSRRLTRQQQTLMKTTRGRRTSNVSRASRSSVSEQEEEDRTAAFDLQPIDRISLLEKESYDAMRAASESKVVKPAKINRRVASVDIPEVSPFGSPSDTPGRSRRASFTRAVEALHTPKGRRQSTDSRKSDIGSPVGSPPSSEADASVTPRRGRRASNTSQTARNRSKKMPVLEED